MYLETLDLNESYVLILFVVPQGFILGALFSSPRSPFSHLFILFTANITSLIPSHSATDHLFAEDVQAYVHGPSSASLMVAGRIQALTHYIYIF